MYTSTSLRISRKNKPFFQLKTPRDKYKKKMQNKRFSTILSGTIRLEKVVNLTYTELVVKLVSTSQVGDVDAVVKITFVRNTTIGGRKHE